MQTYHAGATRQQQLQDVVTRYLEALRQRDFSAIPFADDTTLRAPLAPGGVHHPLVGKVAVLEHWWLPLQPALENVDIVLLETFFNGALTAVCAEALITLNVMSPPVTLRVADRFTVNDAGQIVERENHFDPRDVTNPGWQTG